MDVFLCHFSLVEFRVNGWYGFEEKYHARKLFLQENDRKLFTDRELFFLTSPEPWPCPVLWSGPPSKYKSYSMVRDALPTSQQKKTMAKLLEAHGTAVDLRTYLSDTKLAAAFSPNLASSPPGLVLDSTGAKGKLASDTPDTWFLFEHRLSTLETRSTPCAGSTACRRPTPRAPLATGPSSLRLLSGPCACTRTRWRPGCASHCTASSPLKKKKKSFFSQALTHFRLAPGQLTPSGWRVLVGFVVLCHDAGVQPSTDVFCYFFSLCPYTSGWYGFRAKHDGCALFKGWYFSGSEETWKDRFFFLTSPEPWSCPVFWGERPSKYKRSWIARDEAPALTTQQKKTVAKLLDAHGTAVDLQTYLSDTKLAVVFSSNVASPPPGAKGMDSSAAKVKTEPDGEPTVSLKKRKHEEATISKDGVPEHSTPHAAHGCSASASGLRAPPGFDPKARHLPVPDTHDGDSADWEAAKKVLECITTPSRERGFAAASPSDVVASSYSAMLQAANYASFSFGYAVELEKKLAARDKENSALRVQLESAKTELTAAKRAAEADGKANKTTAV
ncbi:uncharacterized protein LOC119333187 [Triticum dicoccoides]|uniref:uncharacterized protein LOC119333187 n=1 Tax=Triticum dicoccoides TaxID=85692 RepID=UPI001890CF3C|nr:uncharacterized protein LOC119333187 [Triticum dicoccoides]